MIKKSDEPEYNIFARPKYLQLVLHMSNSIEIVLPTEHLLCIPSSVHRQQTVVSLVDRQIRTPTAYDLQPIIASFLLWANFGRGVGVVIRLLHGLPLAPSARSDSSSQPANREGSCRNDASKTGESGRLLLTGKRCNQINRRYSYVCIRDAGGCWPPVSFFFLFGFSRCRLHP
jgi:hypothetical protein